MRMHMQKLTPTRCSGRCRRSRKTMHSSTKSSASDVAEIEAVVPTHSSALRLAAASSCCRVWAASITRISSHVSDDVFVALGMA